MYDLTWLGKRDAAKLGRTQYAMAPKVAVWKGKQMLCILLFRHVRSKCRDTSISQFYFKLVFQGAKLASEDSAGYSRYDGGKS